MFIIFSILFITLTVSFIIGNGKYSGIINFITGFTTQVITSALIAFAFSFIFFIFGSIITTILVPSRYEVQAIYKLDDIDGEYYTTHYNKKGETIRDFQYVDDTGTVNIVSKNANEIQISYISNDVEPYMYVMEQRYMIRGFNYTFTVINGGSDFMGNKMYKLFIPKK